MSKSRRFLVIFFAVAVVETTLLVAVGKYVGWWLVIGESLVSAAVGIGLTSFALWRYAPALINRLNTEESCEDELISSLVLAVAGVLLLIPGFITDALALALLFPAMRRLLVSRLRRAPDSAGPPETAAELPDEIVARQDENLVR